MQKQAKKLAPKPLYVSPKQLAIVGFETPFERHLNPANRWVVLAKLLPWDEICNVYLKEVGTSQTGRKPINPRIMIGALIIKHLGDLDDREAILQISENVYMQYFLGYPSFDSQPSFDPSLFVEIRKRLGMEAVNALNEKIIALKTQMESSSKESSTPETKSEEKDDGDDSTIENKGRVIFDATACPQDIAYPTDLTLLSDAREKSEELIDKLYNPEIHAAKPSNYRENARKEYLVFASKLIR